MLARFLRDEQGSYTLWSLTWFLIYCAIGGLAVDVTNAYRVQERLQSTADAAALAAAISLPSQDAAVDQAITFSEGNMNSSLEGVVLRESDVSVGTWDMATRTFGAGGLAPNAVRVVTRRSNQNANPVGMSVLRIAAMFGMNPEWDISTEAIAIRFIPSCLNDGFIALNRVDINSNNNLTRRICLHGQNAGVDLQNHNYFEPGVRVSMGNLDMLPDRTNLFDINPGLAEALAEGEIYPRDIDYVGIMIDGLRNLDPNYVPEYMYRQDSSGNIIAPTKVTVTDLPATLNQYTVYVVNCNGQVKLPKDLVSKVVVVADCRIQSSSGTSLQDVVVGTSYASNNAAISMAAQTNLGRPDDCAPGGGVELYSPGDIHIAAQGEWHGLRVVGGRDVDMTAMNTGVYGMSVQAGHDISFTSNNNFALCNGGVPGRFAWHYRLVR